jgi:hypothetical protein
MEVSFHFRQIDPVIEKILGLSFLNTLMDAWGVKAIKAKPFVCKLRGQPAIFAVKEKEIWIDPSVEMDQVIARLNSENAKGLVLKGLQEGWAFVICHEVGHSNPENSEYDCNLFAIKKVCELREEVMKHGT